MQDVSLKNFKDDIDSVKEYIKHIDLINKIEASNRNTSEDTLKSFINHLHYFGRSKKLFEYKSIVISLYGAVEKNIGIWIKEHIENISIIISDYDKLPKKLRDNHFNLSMKLISIVSEGRYIKYDHLNKEELLTNLSDCITNTSNYSLNSDAFSPLSGNLKHSKISEAFKALNIDLSYEIKTNKIFSTFLKRKYGNNIANKGDELFKIVDDLVIRRNDIAHGVNIDNILSITEFDSYIEFIEKYGQVIFEIIIEKEYKYEAEFLSKKVMKIHGVYNNGTILCFEIEDCIIKVGNYIIIETPDGQFMKKEILEIKKEKIKYTNLIISEKTDIGINLGGGITKKQKFYIKS